MYNIVGNKKIWFTLSAALVGVSVVAIVLFGFRQGIDFAGGTLWEFSAVGENESSIASLFTTDLGINDARVSYDTTNQNFLIRTGEIGEADHQKFLNTLKEKFPTFQERSFQSIGPSVGNELRRNALIAVVLVLVGISLYIAFAFRKTSRPVSSWKYGWMTLIALFHDVAIPAGLLAALGYYASVEIDSNFVVALLVVMGFSVHDTIVVFDRVRENLVLNRGKDSFGHVVNTSVNQTLARSINTSLTLILVLIALYFTGPADLRYFILTLLVGVSVGIYSSICIASPGLVLLSPKTALTKKP